MFFSFKAYLDNFFLLLKLFLYIFCSVRVNQKQISILLSEKTKTKNGFKNTLWSDIAKKLNDEGPCNKSPDLWKVVNIKLFSKIQNFKNQITF